MVKETVELLGLWLSDIGGVGGDFINAASGSGDFKMTFGLYSVLAITDAGIVGAGAGAGIHFTVGASIGFMEAWCCW